jgi:serine/threonine protein kinase
MEGSSLAEGISMNPVWRTPTAKGKATAGILLGLRFARGLGLLHGHLSSTNILFDTDHRIQIVEFGSIRLEVQESEIGGFSGVEWTPKTDVRACAPILFGIVVGRPAKDETSVPNDIPELVSKIIEAELCAESETQRSVCDIFTIVKQNNFQIVEGVDHSRGDDLRQLG